MNPLVTVIMPTRSRRDFAAKALECFRAQTYEPRELVIVDDEDDPSFATAPEGASYHRIPGVASIGAKRNMACAAAAGDIIAHFDSDDISAPGRLADQVSVLQESGKSVTGYHSLKFFDEAGAWYYNTNAANWAFDASLVYRRDWWQGHPFDSINDGLEAGFRHAAVQAGELIAVAGGDMLHVSIHGGNTSKRVIGAGWKKI